MTRRALLAGAAVPAVIAGWTASASAIITAGLGYWNHIGWPEKAWIWWEYLGYLHHDRLLDTWLQRSAMGATGLLAAAGLGLGYAYATRSMPRPRTWRLFGRPALQRGTSDNHGHADWASARELRRRFPGPSPRYGGVVVGELDFPFRDWRAGVPFDPHDKRTWGLGGKAKLLIDPLTRGSGHSLVFAGPQSGKSMAAVSTCLHWTGSLVVLDPSCELTPLLAEARHAMGHKVHVITPENPGASFNVLDWIDVGHPLASTHVNQVVLWVCGDIKAKDATAEHWANQGRKLVTCILADILWDKQLAPQHKTLRAMRHVISQPETKLRSHLQKIHASSDSSMARSLAGPLSDMAAEETFSSIASNAHEATAWLATPAFADLVSGAGFKAADLAKDKMTVFVQIPLGDLLTSPAVGRTIIGALLNAVFQANGKIIAAGRRVEDKVLFLLDEAAQLGRMSVLEQARDTGRKYGICLQQLFQSSAQLVEIWGKEGKRAWIDGTSWQAYSSIRDEDTAEEVSKACGEHAVIAYSDAQNAGTQAGSGWGGSRGVNISVHEIKRRLATPGELREARTDERFIVGAMGKVARVGSPLWYRRKEMVRQLEAP
jgi:type IV secretion system protein VirD4